jgi:hypothetical protein
MGAHPVRKSRGPCQRAALLGVALLGVAAACAAPAGAQLQPGGGPRPGGTAAASVADEVYSTGTHVQVLGINAALGGITAGIRKHHRGGSFWRGFLEGAAGGGAIYAGKWVSAEGFWGAGLVGRQVAAVGTSVVRNSSENRPLFEQLMLPLGPLRLYADLGGTVPARLKLDLLASGTFAYRLLSSDARFDGDASLSAGTPVFFTDVAPNPGWYGNNTAGVILLRQEPEAGPARVTGDMVFAHERIHLIQYDQAMQSWSTPLEQWLLPKLPGGSWLARHVDVGLVMIPAVLLNHVIPYESRPWEREADYFSRFHGPHTPPQHRPGI